MLVFLVPLKSRRVARSWTRTCAVFERTLRSICRQTSTRFRVLVVCHEIPEIGFSHPSVDYLPVTFPAPADERPARLSDRCRKETEGQRAAREYGRCHLFKVDADDCVSRRMAAFVESRPDANGWFVDRGYVYLEGGGRVRPRASDFHRWCGTAAIVRPELLPEQYVPHMHVADTLAARGTPLEPLPFAGAVYVVGHGDNSGEFGAEELFLSRHALVRAARRALSLRPLTAEIRDEFGLYDIDAGRPTP